MLYHPPPETHAVYADRSKTGAPRVAVTYARKGRRGGGRRILTLTGADRDAAHQALSDILRAHTGKRLRPLTDAAPCGEYHAINEYCANHMLLAMRAVKDAKDARRVSGSETTRCKRWNMKVSLLHANRVRDEEKVICYQLELRK